MLLSVEMAVVVIIFSRLCKLFLAHIFSSSMYDGFKYSAIHFLPQVTSEMVTFFSHASKSAVI